MGVRQSYPKKATKGYIGKDASFRGLWPAAKSCKFCDTLFVPSTRAKQCCSTECTERHIHREAFKSHPIKKCHCGKVMKPSHRSQFCSKECRYATYIVYLDNGQVIDNRHNSRPQKPNPEKYHCKVCGCVRYWDKNKGTRNVFMCRKCNGKNGSLASAKTAGHRAYIRAKQATPKSIGNNRGSHRERAIKYGRKYVTGINAKKLAEIYNYECQECGIQVQKHHGAWHPEGWTVGHIQPLARGGHHIWDNVQLECQACNTWKSTNKPKVDWSQIEQQI